MKRVKSLSLLLLALASVTAAVAGSASATTATCGGVVCTPSIHASSEGHITTHGSNGITAECLSTIAAKIEVHGTAVTAEGNVSALIIGGAGGATTACTAGEIVHVVQKGKLIFHTIGSGPNATVTMSDQVITKTVTALGFPVTCEYSTGSNLDIGELTGAPSATGHATIHIRATTPRTGGSSLCGSTATSTGSYKVTSPTGLGFH
jgi:hypothetical protein